MASGTSDGPELFDKDELDYVATNLSDEAVNPESALQDTEPCFAEQLGPEFTSWVGGPAAYKSICSYKRSGKVLTSSLWKVSKEMNMINNLSPNFIFLTVPDSITDIKQAWRCILCTLISEISNYITNVPADKMMDSGIWGGQFTRKYLQNDDRQGDDSEEEDSIESLIELLRGLQHCNFMVGDMEETSSGTKRVEYIYVFVIDRIERFSKGKGSDYLARFKEVIDQTLRVRMGAYIFSVEEDK
ncbi:hypothetical protein F4824DRAFT_504948 [Ustulina deusta]|nr:hypothetical protein F4824DRAFT_504948 [Ustulina deusta]